MSGHTPGPWEAEPSGGKGSWIKGANGEWAALACGNSDDSAEANARLIAAAPEMLDALELFIADHRNTYDGEPLTSDMARFIDKAYNAVEKAKGAKP